MNNTLKNIGAAVISAVLLASGAWAFATEGRLSKVEVVAATLERIEDKLDKIREEQALVRADLGRVARPRVVVVPAPPVIASPVQPRTERPLAP